MTKSGSRSRGAKQAQSRADIPMPAGNSTGRFNDSYD